jgi:hypothetical protein
MTEARSRESRRAFLRGLFASTAAVVVAPVAALEALDEFVPRPGDPHRTYVDMRVSFKNDIEAQIERLKSEARKYRLEQRAELDFLQGVRWAWRGLTDNGSVYVAAKAVDR